MKKGHLILALGCVLAGGRAAALEITLPPETAQLVESPLPGYTLAQAMCLTCHSADYMRMQPVSSRTYWQASVTKMQKTFGAPIPDSAVEPLVDYLAKTYGTERTAAASPPTAPRATGDAATAPAAAKTSSAAGQRKR